MRPRVFPAEDVRNGSKRDRHVVVASMRPRVFPAEDGMLSFWMPSRKPLQ